MRFGHIAVASPTSETSSYYYCYCYYNCYYYYHYHYHHYYHYHQYTASLIYSTRHDCWV